MCPRSKLRDQSGAVISKWDRKNSFVVRVGRMIQYTHHTLKTLQVGIQSLDRCIGPGETVPLSRWELLEKHYSEYYPSRIA